jgi:hypothetical protein
MTLASGWMAEGFRRAADRQGDGWRIPPPEPGALVTSDADATWLRARVTDQRLRTFTEPTRLTGPVHEVPRSRSSHARRSSRSATGQRPSGRQS